MSRDDGHHADQAVFAGDRLSRQWVLRAVAVGGAALLATWLVALALGALGGFEALPGLPDQSGGRSHEARSGKVAKPAPVTRRDDHGRGVDEEPGSNTGSSVPSQPVSHPAPSRAPRLKPAPAPAVSVTTTVTKPGKRLGTTQTSGPPLDSPGNGPGGAGPPGQAG
ncbi:MAG: hypothetical protein ACRDK5_11535 [Solirubrobacterales bacterium]